MKEIKAKQNCLFQIISYIMMTVALLGLIWFIQNKIDFLLVSDDSSELVLGKLLASENRLLSKNWYYSTELRILNTQIFYAFFFKLTNDWHLVRVISYICMYSVMLGVYYFLCKMLNCKKYYAVTAALLFLPFSDTYFEFVLKGAYYIPHITITFLTLGLAEIYIEHNKKKWEICLGCSALLSILAGMGGARQIIILYLPLFLGASVSILLRYLNVKKNKMDFSVKAAIQCIKPRNIRAFLYTFVLFVGSVIGYVINIKVLNGIYHFKLWDGIEYTEFNFSRISQIINGILSVFGYSSGNIFTVATFKNFICLCWITLTVSSIIYTINKRNEVDEKHVRLAVFTLSAYAVYILLFLFTDMAYEERYVLPIIILSAPMIAVLFENLKWIGITKNAVILSFVILVGINSCFYYSIKGKQDVTKELRNIANVLVQNDYCEGYSTFWRANVLTELSDGNIDVWCWCDDIDDTALFGISDIDTTFKWLQLVSHDNSHPNEKLFILFTTGEADNNNWKGKIDFSNIIYQSESYLVIGYDSYEKLISDISK